jgi:hypothetical protein
MLNTLLQPDDPEEEDWFSDYHRMTNFLFGDVKLPVAHFFRMFWALGVNMALSAQGRKTYKKAIFDSIDFAANELIPASLLQVNNFLEYNDVTGTIEIVPAKYTQGAVPSWLSPITDVMLNRDYMGSTISKEPYIASDADHYKKLKYEKRNTAEEYQNAARILHLITGGDPDRLVKGYDGGLDINGSMIQHIAEGYSGGVGRTLFDAYISLASAIDPEREVEVKHVPVLNKMLKPYKEETAYNQEYWTLYKSLEHYKKYIKEGDADWKRRERQTERYDAYQDLKGLLNKKPEEGKQYSAEDVKKLMEANKRWRSVM